MKLKIKHAWLLMGICIFGVLNVESFDYEKYKNKNHLNKSLPIFEKHFSDFIIDELDKLSETGKSVSIKKQENDTVPSVKSERSIASKIYKKLPLHSCKSDEKSHVKRDNFFFRLFSDNYKPRKQRSMIKKRESNGYVRKMEIMNDSFYPSISHSVIPLTHFGRERKNDDKICKTQIIKFFPKPMRKSFDSKYDVGNESHKQLSNDDEWELRQDIFVEEILPFREKNDFGFKDTFHDEAKTIFDDILSIFTMFPFQFFDTIYVKVSTTEKPNLVITSDNGEQSERAEYTTYFDNLRNKRQISGSVASSVDNLTSSNTTLPADQSKDTIVVADSSTNNLTETISTEVANVTANKTTSEATENKIMTKTDKVISNTNTSSVLVNNTHTSSAYDKEALISTNATQHIEHEKASSVFSTTETKLSSVPRLIDMTTVNVLSKQKILKQKEIELIDLQENDMERRYNEKMIKNIIEEEDKELDSDKNAFLMVLGIIPGLIGLIIAVGVVGIWMIQKNSTWVERNNQGTEPTTSQGKPVLSCNI